MRRSLLSVAAILCASAAGGCCASEYTMIVESNASPINDGYPVKVDIVISRDKASSEELDKKDIARWFEGGRDDFAIRPINLTIPGEKNFRRTILLRLGDAADSGQETVGAPGSDLIRTIPGDLDALYVFAHYRGAGDAVRKKKIAADDFLCKTGRVVISLGKNAIRDVAVVE